MKSILASVFFLCICSDVSAAVRLCSQNLQRLGAVGNSLESLQGNTALLEIASRVEDVGCDLIAVQEVGGKNKQDAGLVLERLASEIELRLGGSFLVFVGSSYDPNIRNGFLVREDLGKVLQLYDYSSLTLPKLQPLAPNQHFGRAPLGLLIELSSNEGMTPQGDFPERLFIVTIHFKSQAQSWRDLSGLRFEILRMEMAAGVLESIKREAQEFGKETPVVVLGDRNSDQFSAAAGVLKGELMLEDFSKPGRCRVDPDLQPICKKTVNHQPFLVSLFTELWNQRGKPDNMGSYRYRKKVQLLDDILVSPLGMRYFVDRDGQVEAGFEGDFDRGSDHLLLWAELGAVGS